MSRYTLESIVAIPACILLIIGLIVLSWAFNRAYRKDELQDGMFKFLSYTCIVLAFATAVGLWWGMYPWKEEYHRWQRVSGTVQEIESRLLPSSGGSGMEEKHAVQFEHKEQIYGVTDTRAATVEKGDYLIIECVKRWQWSGQHGYDCNFLDLRKEG